MRPPAPAVVRMLVWVAMAAGYMLVGSVAPFVLLLGWWEALPAVLIAVLLSDRAGAWAERARSGAAVTPPGDTG